MTAPPFVAGGDDDSVGRPEIIDPDVDPDDVGERREPAPPGITRVLAAIAVGGVLGAEARYGVGVALPHAAADWPWATLLINLSGCVAIGVFMVLISERGPVHPLIRPLLGMGVLGGYTTFSTYAGDAITLVGSGRVVAAVGYIAISPVLAVLGVTVGALTTRALAASR